MSEAHLRGASLSKARLAGADLRGADLRGADLQRADLTGADLTGADLTEADLSRADLCGSRLDSATLSRAKLLETDLSGSSLNQTNLTDADLSGATMFRCAFDRVNAEGLRAPEATFSNSYMTTVDLSRANLRKADFSGAYMEKVAFRDADLSNASFRGANHSSVDMSGARLKGASFEHVKGYSKAELRELKERGIKIVRFTYVHVVIVIAAIILSGYLSWFFFTRPPVYYPTRDMVPPEIRVLCVGDSHIMGYNVKKGMDFPSQLEALLNNEDRAHGYRISKLGGWNCNSSEAANLVVQAANGPLHYAVVVFSAGKNNEHVLREASVLPSPIREADFRAKMQYLLQEKSRFRWSDTTKQHLSRLYALPGGPSQDYQKWNSLLDVNGVSEIAFLSSWLEEDIRTLHASLATHGIRLVLLNYFQDCLWVDRSFESISRLLGIPFVDIRDFGFSDQEKAGRLISGVTHPNKYGYARIAKLVQQAIMKNGLVPGPVQ